MNICKLKIGLTDLKAFCVRHLSLLLLLPLLAMPVATSLVYGQSASDSLRKTAAETIETRRLAQKGQDRWHRDREKLLTRLKTLENEKKGLAETNQALTQRLAAVRQRVEKKKDQLKEMKRMGQELQPFLVALVDRLERNVSDQMPFLLQERSGRIHRLREVMDDPKTAVSEKFRKVLEAYLVEVEYGNTTEVYQENLSLAGRAILANVLRLGRISLFCQTLDEKQTGYLDPATGDWKPLARGYERQIRLAMEMGAKQRPADLLSLPIGRIEAP